MGHLHGDEFGPGPFNLGPWSISKAENMDQGHWTHAHGILLQWWTWTWAINLGPWVICMWKTWTRAIISLPMGHFESRKNGPGPMKLCPWVISKVENIDQGHWNWAHGSFPWWWTWTRAIYSETMGHIQSRRHGWGPLNLYLWDIFMLVNILIYLAD